MKADEQIQESCVRAYRKAAIFKKMLDGKGEEHVSAAREILHATLKGIHSSEFDKFLPLLLSRLDEWEYGQNGGSENGR